MKFKTVRFKNILSFGNTMTEVRLDSNQIVSISGVNGAGKCLRGESRIDVKVNGNPSWLELQELYVLNDSMDYLKRNKIEVKTKFGFKRIQAIDITARNSQIIKLTLRTRQILEGSPDHLVWAKIDEFESWVRLKDLTTKYRVETERGFQPVISVELLSEREDLYDIQVEGVNEYYCHGMRVHNSTILEAVHFAFTGKPYRKINKPDLVNTINRKELLVELEFSHKQNDFLIRRGIKPNIFEIYKNGSLVPEDSTVRDYQDVLEQAVEMPSSIIRQTIILSYRFYKPFLELDARDKREFIENMLSIKLFSTMIEKLKMKLATFKQEEAFLEKDIERINSNIELVNTIAKKQEEEIEKRKIEIQLQIKSLEDEINEKTIQIHDVNKRYKHNETKLQELKQALEKEKVFSQRLSAFTSQVDNLKGHIRFFDENVDHCPVCEQTIDSQFRDKKIEEYRDAIGLIQKDMDVVLERLNRFDEVRNKISGLVDGNFELMKIMSTETSSIKLKKEQITDLQKQFNNAIASLQDEINKEDLVKQHQRVKSKIKKIKKYREYTSIVIKMLSEKGIKKFILSKYIPILNKVTNDYLQLLEAPYAISFNDQLEEKIMARNYEDLGYASFSNGEKQRCDLALLFAFLEISKLKSNMDSNLICFDELFADLDTSGLNGLYKIFHNLKGKGYTILVVTHSQAIKELADVQIDVVKKRFSQLEKAL